MDALKMQDNGDLSTATLSRGGVGLLRGSGGVFAKEVESW